MAAFKRVGIPDAKLEKFTHKVTEDLRQDGFRVLDQKPVHYIIRLRPDGTIMKNKKDDIPFALVDFELLQRTPEHEEKTRKARRADYLARQRDPFKKDLNKEWPPYLHSVTIMGVDYVWGIAESTNGMLWVVGDDPDLFDYFLPERWRKTPQTKLSSNNDIYYTKTKDDINIVWKVSRVGERPDVSPDDRGEIVAHGCNSPFEKFAIAFELSRKGIDIVYPRAIYMTGNPSESPESIQDKSRFKSHSLIHTPTGESVLREDHDYITIWGFWRGLDASMAKRDIGYLTRQNAFNMFRRHLITEQEFLELMDRVKRLLFKHGYENLTLKGNHVLLSLNPQGGLLCDVKGKPAFRLCNFEFIKKL